MSGLPKSKFFLCFVILINLFIEFRKLILKLEIDTSNEGKRFSPTYNVHVLSTSDRCILILS